MVTRQDPINLDSIYNDLEIFKARTREEIRRSKRYLTFISLVFLDISHVNSPDEIENFSEIGQFYAGLGSLIRNSIRETDLISSNGFGKIAILLLETPREGASAFSRRLKKTVKYFLCNNTRSPLNWRVPITEGCFPGAEGEAESILNIIDSMSN